MVHLLAGTKNSCVNHKKWGQITEGFRRGETNNFYWLGSGGTRGRLRLDEKIVLVDARLRAGRLFSSVVGDRMEKYGRSPLFC